MPSSPPSSLAPPSTPTTLDAYVAGFDTALAEVLELHREDRLFAASRKLAALDQAAASIELPDAGGDGSSSELHAKFEQCKAALQAPEIFAVRKESNELERVMAEFKTVDSSWKQLASGKVSVWHRHESFTTIHSLRSESILDVPLMHLLVLIYEIDLFAGILPFMQFSRQLKAVGRCRKLAHLGFSIMWPIAPRDVVVSAWGADGLFEDECVVVYASSHGDMHGQAVPPPAEGTVRMEFNFGGVFLQPVAPSRTRLVMFQNIDPKIERVPATLINFVTRSMISFGIHMIEKKAKRLAGTPHEERIKSNPEFYRWLEGRIGSYFALRRDQAENGLYA